MPSKLLSKTDLEKCAIVLTDELSRLLHQRGVFPALGGGGSLVVHAVRMFFVNSGEDLLVSFYAALRDGKRPIEERLWNQAFGSTATVGDEFVLEFDGERFLAEIRPPP